jgi:hypothetical protein
MVQVKDQLIKTIDCLPETEQILLLEIAKRFILYDDTATVEDLTDIQQADEDFTNGLFYRDEDINWK